MTGERAHATLPVPTIVDFTGPQNGPFPVASVSVPITNQTGNPIVWGVRQLTPWATFSTTSGALGPGASTTLQVSINSATANGLAVGTYDAFVLHRSQSGGPLGHLATVRLTVQATNAGPMTTASRTSGVAPLSVFFDAVGSGTGVWQPSGSPADYGSVLYRWNFADMAAGAWTHSGKSRNSALGYVAAHVFETPGVYRVTLQLTEPSGTIRDYHQTITVLDPNAAYAGQTYYVSSTTGNDANTGLTAGTPFRTASRAFSVLFASNGPRRVLFKRGETFPASSSLSAYGRTGPFTIGAYGSGANPVIQVQHGGDGVHLDNSVSDVRIIEVDVTGPYPAPAGGGVQLGRHSLLLRSTVRGFYIGVGGHHEFCNNNTVANCSLIENGSYGLYYSPGYNPAGPDDPPIHLAVIGNRFDGTTSNSLMRTYISRSVWQSNLFLRAGSSTARLMGTHSPKKSEFNVISDNWFNSVQGWVLEIGPENDENGAGNGAQQIVENLVLENNRFSTPGPGYVNKYVLIWGSHVTVRNNIFDHQNGTTGGAIWVNRRGIGPVPVGVRIDNNTAYRGNSSLNYVFVDAYSQDATLVRNNVVYNAGGPEVAGTGSVSLVGNELGNPQFNDAATGDFRLRPTSPAVDNGVNLLMRMDYMGNLRPAQSTLSDAGALEKL